MGCNCGKKKGSVSQVKKIVKPQANKPLNGQNTTLRRVIRRTTN